MSVELQEKPIKKAPKKKETKKKLEIEIVKAEEPKPEPEPVGGASQLLDADKSKALISHQPEPEPIEEVKMEEVKMEEPIQKEKVKKPRSEKQMEAFNRARQKRSEYAVQRQAEKEILMKEIEKLAEEEQKKAMKEMQDVIVEKAVKIKRNQIKKIQEVDENTLDVNSIKKIVNPYQDFKKKFDIR